MNPKNNQIKVREKMATAFLVMKLFTLGGLSAGVAKLFTSCDNGTTEKPAQPITVTIEVPAEHTHLSPGAKITVVFPANFNATRLEAIRGKLVEAVERLNVNAGNSNDLKGKIRAILARGLKITIEETDSVTYGTKVVDNQLVVETAFLEHAGVGGGQIAAGIISMINNGHLVAKASQVPVTPTTV